MWDKLVILGGDFTIIQLVLTLTKLFDSDSSFSKESVTVM